MAAERLPTSFSREHHLVFRDHVPTKRHLSPTVNTPLQLFFIFWLTPVWGVCSDRVHASVEKSLSHHKPFSRSGSLQRDHIAAHPDVFLTRSGITMTPDQTNNPLARLDGIEVVCGLLLHAGAVCPKCAYGTRVTSKNWARCKKCGARVPRRKLP